MARFSEFNHYGLPNSLEDWEQHQRHLPFQPKDYDAVERIISAATPEALAAVVLHYETLLKP